MAYAELGSVISGTMRNEDVIPALVDVLRPLNAADNGDEGYSDIIADADALEDFDTEDADNIREHLFDALQAFAPPYAYFGAHPGDGSDYGFWLSESFQQDAEDNGAEIVSDLSEVPEGYEGEVLHLNDHGNATLYWQRADGSVTELWSVV